MLTVLLTSSLTFAAYDYYSSIDRLNYDDFRVAILFVILSGLVPRLLYPLKDSSIVQALTATRQDLALGKIEVPAAVNQAEIALAGLRVGDILQEDLRDFLKVIRDLDAAFHDSIERLEAVLVDLPTVANSIPSEKLSIARSILELIDTKSRGRTEKIDSLKETLQKIQSRVRWVGGKTEESAKGIEEVWKTVDRALDGTLARSKECRDKADALRSRINAPPQA